MIRSIIHSFSSAQKAVIVLLVMLLILLIIQTISINILEVVLRKKYSPDWEHPELSEIEQIQQRIAEADKVFLPDGTLHLLHSDWTARQEMIEVYDTAGQMLWKGSRSDLPHEYLKPADVLYKEDWTGYLRVSENFSRDLIFTVRNEKKQIREFWRYDFNKRYFTGYGLQKHILGYLSASGFTESRSEIRPFEPIQNFHAWIPAVSWNPRCLLWTEHSLFEADFEKRSIEILYENPSVPIGRLFMVNWKETASYKPSFLSAILIDLIDQPPILLQKNPRKAIPLQIPDELLKKGRRTFYSSGQSFYLEVHWLPKAPMDNKQYRKWLQENRDKPLDYRIELYQIREDGTFEHLSQFDYIKPPYRPSASVKLYENKCSQFKGWVTFSSPPCFAWFRKILTVLWESERYILEDLKEFTERMEPTNPYLYYSAASVLTILTLLHYKPRRVGWFKGTVWLAVVFCFNLAGFLTYLALNHYPVVRCHSCGRRRGLNRPDCPACGAPLPSPPARDTDLLYPPSPQTMVS
ncbi:MAG TPA: hypothetical protein PK054_07745 [Anaerohalosphaeraceae bacterium]|nr:hypothetical protein [Anaerohalosphaeraceae bacterium]HOL89010.1 hypothetical protein [Anaerohalosphaeraceae bacterium]HPP56461.1 hypothetical protein [Anaerohalosphaeraceae bacterium]